MGLLAKASREDDERAYLLFGSQKLYILGAELRCYHYDGKISRWHLLHVMKHFNTLHLVFFRVDNTQNTLETTCQEVAYNRTSWLVNVVRATNHYNAFGL